MCQHLITNVAQEGKMSVMGEMGGSPGELSSHLVCYEAKTAPQFLNFKMILKTKQTYKDALSVTGSGKLAMIHYCRRQQKTVT